MPSTFVGASNLQSYTKPYERPSILFCVVVARKMWYTNMVDSNSCYASVGEKILYEYSFFTVPQSM